MLTAATKALSQMWTPPFRAVLLKSVGLALLVLIVLGVVLQRLLVWGLESGGAWLRTSLPSLGGGVGAIEILLAVLVSLGLVAAMIFLMPAVTGLIAGVFADEIAERVERTHYPQDPPGMALPLAPAMLEGVRTALLALLVYLVAVPFLLVAGLGAVIFFLASAYLLGREYFHLAAMRFMPRAEAKALRRQHSAAVFRAGLLIAAFVSIPVVNLATPLFATAMMVHIHKRLAESRAVPARR
jgi:CysZ protein